MGPTSLDERPNSGGGSSGSREAYPYFHCTCFTAQFQYASAILTSEARLAAGTREASKNSIGMLDVRRNSEVKDAYASPASTRAARMTISYFRRIAINSTWRVVCRRSRLRFFQTEH